ncbi:hypothetical protein D0B54_08160 [Solimonas sp. K1W22B-7]|uniref:hypothetical protein n=1 Tax=Solimonas sp. K1W22B-7 TaxID=2303331 RepID=UPI000E33399F|nr:hypothetical protein [Solimonas sp. K1W22B-7]AXQ28655.1 hypothetical protein D0B54_08160 [Solimonas sp. K1W22B-7]
MHAGILVALTLLTMAACKQAPPPAETSAAKTAVAATPADAPPAAGRCAGWRARLGKDPEKTQSVETCLRKMALRDRVAAVAEARILLDWKLPPDSGLQLVAVTLQRFPEAAALETFMQETGLQLKAAPTEARESWAPLTIADHLAERGQVLGFDVETGMFPNAHEGLMGELAQLAGPPMSWAKFSEVPPGDPDDTSLPYRLRARLGIKNYDVAARNFGDWYDVASVLDLLNLMSEDAGSQARFFSLPTGDQTAQVLVADRQVIAGLVESGLLQLQAPDRSREAGQAYEAEALGKFRQEIRAQ